MNLDDSFQHENGHGIFSGGDGSSLEKAMIVNTTDSNLGIDAEYEFVSDQCGVRNVDWRLQGQSQKTYNGIPYDILVVEFPDGSTKQFYFNISKFFGKGPSDLDWLLAD